ncbi:tripartite tricarboxylate transporter permease [Pseudochelatococcus sp. B33]
MPSLPACRFCSAWNCRLQLFGESAGKTMENLGLLVGGLGIAMEPQNLMFAFIGALIGTLVGILPGLGPSVALGLLLPFTYGLPPTGALIMFAGIYYGAMYGGSSTSILLKVPGEASSVVTSIDGYAMRQAGRAGAALGIAAIGSFIAGVLAALGLAFLAGPMTKLALVLGRPEIFMLVVLALTLVVTLSNGEVYKGLISASGGLLLATVGPDLFSGMPRFTFGIPELFGGFEIVIIVLGLFAITEVASTMPTITLVKGAVSFRLRNLLPNREEFRLSRMPIFRGSILGFFLGVMPGAGPGIAPFISYAIERNLSRHPERFGKGAIEGVAGPESANNSAATGALLPLLTLGIPGSGTAAIMLGAFLIFGLEPGPQLFRDHPDVAWGLIASMLVGNLMLLVLNLPLVGVFIQLLRLPYAALATGTVMLSVVGAYSINKTMWDVWMVLAFGLLGFVMRRLSYPLIPLVLAFVLGPLAEKSFRQSVLLSDSGFAIFVERPLSLALLIALVVVLLLLVINQLSPDTFGRLAKVRK